MSRSGDTTATAGYDARWPLRAYPLTRFLMDGPKPRTALALAARALLQKSLVEDTLCAMENDGIVIASASAEHLTRGERISLLAQDAGAILVSQVTVSLSEKGRRFVAQHDQASEAGVCQCEWCAELAEIRAWAEKQTPEQISAAWRAIAAQIS